ncbi:MAG TPA: response regulator [Thermoanaerobaculia bacterium]|nr:response regulator [Thermoanaerobaculia bacterium]
MGIHAALRAAAILIIATGLNEVIAGSVPRYEPLYLYLAAIALITWLDGAILGALGAAGAIAFYALLFLPRPMTFSRTLLVPLVAALAVVVVLGIVRGVVRARHRSVPVPAAEVVFPRLVQPLLAAPDNTEVLHALDALRQELRERESAAQSLATAREYADATARDLASVRADRDAAQRELAAARAERDAARELAESATRDVAVSNEQAEANARELAAARAERDAMRSELETTVGELAAARGEAAAKAHHLGEAHTRADVAAQELAALRDQLRAQSTANERELAAARAERDATRSELETTVGELAAARGEAAAKARHLAEAQTRVAVTAQEVTALRDQLGAQSAASERELAAARAERDAAVDAIARDLAAARDVAETHAREAVEVRERADVIARELVATREETSSLVARVTELELARSETEESAYHQVAQERALRERLELDAATLRTRIDELEQSLAEVAAAHAEAEAALRTANADFDTKLSTIVAHLAEDHESDLGKAVEEREEARAEIRSLTARLAALQKKYDEEHQRSKRPRVLIVHPDAELRNNARLSLERAGYEILGAGDGLEALRTAYAERPDVVIADAIMPKMDGRELCQLLKSQEKTAHIRVILLTRSDEQPKGDLPPDGVLRKPVPLETLKSTLAALIARTDR